jgi:hypothetical protein
MVFLNRQSTSGCVSLAPGHAAVCAPPFFSETLFGLKHTGTLHRAQVRRAVCAESRFAIKKNDMCKVVALHRSSSGFVTGIHRRGPLSERV